MSNVSYQFGKPITLYYSRQSEAFKDLCRLKDKVCIVRGCWTEEATMPHVLRPLAEDMYRAVPWLSDRQTSEHIRG